MDPLIAILILLLAATPMVVALKYGDALLNGVARRRRQSRRKSRHRKTRGLPIRSDEIDKLVGAEDRRDKLDEKIAANLEAFARLSRNASAESSEAVIEQVEQDILARESKFNIYLDYACLQSETLEVLADEARLLRELADVPPEGLPIQDPDPVVDRRTRSSSDKLMASLQDAMNRKSKADRGLRQVGQPDPPTGSMFDATIGDDTTS
jgi:hypothetical protein